MKKNVKVGMSKKVFFILLTQAER